MMLVEYLSPPYPAWSVEQICNACCSPSCGRTLELAELQPEWSSYDALLNPEPEVAYVG